MYSVKVKNQAEVTAALKRIEKRKGRVIPASQLQDGDLFRTGKYGLDIFRRRDGEYSVYSAWQELQGGMCIGVGGAVSGLNNGNQVTLLAHKSDYPVPEKESPVKTFVYPRADGTFCCQNLVYYHNGQHFRITAGKLADLPALHDHQKAGGHKRSSQDNERALNENLYTLQGIPRGLDRAAPEL
jgi:hypothetical protein